MFINIEQADAFSGSYVQIRPADTGTQALGGAVGVFLALIRLRRHITGGLTLFPGTPLLEEAQRGEFDPLSEREMLEELKTFAENLDVDCTFITHHTISGINLTGPDFLKRKDRIVGALEHEIRHGDMDRLAAYRRNKRTL